MDNEAPRYASWMPEAGGYVADGKVVSKSPIYDENGKLKLDVDPSVFATTQSATTSSAQPQVANTLQGNAGVTTANITGSNTDANAPVTNIGANTSLNLNTANPDESAISSPATKSNVAGKVTLSPLDKANQDYMDAAGRGDYQGMINALVEMGNYTGVDYSAQINELRQKREQKIIGIDDDYLTRYKEAEALYNEAIRNGDEETARQALAQMNQITTEQDKWRTAVGYDAAIKDARQRAEEELVIKYETNYLEGVKGMINTITQLVGDYLNFQYDPTQDAALRIAQGYAVRSVREQAISTGMYFSSFTTSAMTKAITELVPVYEKMAKEEMRENINLLQSTASFLMNMEELQFDMWKSQIQLQFQANEEKRAQWQQALESSNARGWVNNEEAAILGVEPGSLSQSAREHAQALQEEIDKENRKLEQDIILAGYKNELEMQLVAEKAKWDDWATQREYSYRDKENRNNAIYKSIYGGNGGSSSNEEEAPTYEITYTDENGKEIKVKGKATKDPITGQWVDPMGNVIGGGSSTTDDVWHSIASIYGTRAATETKEVYEGKKISERDFSNSSNVSDFSKSLISSVMDAYTLPTAEVGPNKAPNIDITPYLEGSYLQKTKDTVAKNKSSYGEDADKTMKAVTNSGNSIINMIADMEKNKVDANTTLATAEVMFTELLESIKEADDDFDYPKYASKKNNVVDIQNPIDVVGSRMPANQGAAAKEDAMIAVIQNIINDNSISANTKQSLAAYLSDYAQKYAAEVGNEGYNALKDAGVWRYLSNSTRPVTTSSKSTTQATQTTTAKTGKAEGTKVYVKTKIPDSSYPTVTDKKAYAKRLGYEYDEEKGQMYYYK